jgi:CRP/FNR family cyclic AMP-dependent transcriptional regulator
MATGLSAAGIARPGVTAGDGPQQRPRGVRLLVAEPELAESLTTAQVEPATQALVARIADVRQGEERILEAEPDRDAGLLGLLVLHGILLREVAMPGTGHAELVGEGDLIMPGGADTGSVTSTIGWRVIDEARVAILDRQFLSRAQEWPQVLSRLTGRALRRNHELAWQSAIRNQTRVDHRIHRLLWHYADRWGRVTPDGVFLKLPLTHECMGKLVGAHRPSVTSAIGMLERRGLLHRPSHGTWLLARSGSPAAVAGPTALRRSA